VIVTHEEATMLGSQQIAETGRVTADVTGAADR
jgi:hypothetical protein